MPHRKQCPRLLLLGLLASACAKPLHTGRLAAFVFVAASAFSHGLLDTLTNGGHGVALWWPFAETRIFSPWQVIEVSPLSLRRFFGERGLTVLLSEFRWVWVPAIAGCLLLVACRRLRRCKAAVNCASISTTKCGDDGSDVHRKQKTGMLPVFLHSWRKR